MHRQRQHRPSRRIRNQTDAVSIDIVFAGIGANVVDGGAYVPRGISLKTYSGIQPVRESHANKPRSGDQTPPTCIDAPVLRRVLRIHSTMNQDHGRTLPGLRSIGRKINVHQDIGIIGPGVFQAATPKEPIFPTGQYVARKNCTRWY